MSLEWIGDEYDGRWHCEGRGIHAGELMELRGNDGEWFLVRIESANRGQTLIAFTSVQGIDFTMRIDPEYHQLRWPLS